MENGKSSGSCFFSPFCLPVRYNKVIDGGVIAILKEGRGYIVSRAEAAGLWLHPYKLLRYHNRSQITDHEP